METYRVLLFDIDNTLLDFTAGAMQSMEAIFLEAGLAYTPEMFGVFQTENNKLWARIERGELTIAGLRDVRWQTILACLGLEADGAAMARGRCWSICTGNTACALRATAPMRSR